MDLGEEKRVYEIPTPEREPLVVPEEAPAEPERETVPA